MTKLPLKKVVVAWSGGVDSTAVLALLLANGYECHVVTSDLYRSRAPRYFEREAAARADLRPHLLEAAKMGGGSLSETHILESDALWAFSPDGIEIPMRNKRWIDLIMAKEVIPQGFINLALGEYVGVDSWLVRDHVPGFDCDHRFLSAYLLTEYGIRYRLISLQDFGESRYKSDRVSLGAAVIGNAITLTTNCMKNQHTDCGECYKCIERAAAFDHLSVKDITRYDWDPRKHPMYESYRSQMRGEDVTFSVKEFNQ